MPFPNEHACRLADPDRFDQLRRRNNAGTVDGRRVDHIIGVRGGTSQRQSIRYPLSAGWDGDAATRRAREHCREQDGRFEPASNSDGDSRSLAMFEGAWAIRPDALAPIMQALVHAPETPSGAGDDADELDTAAMRGQQRARGGSVAIIPVQGVITPRPSLLGLLFGVDGSLTGIRRALAEAVADDSVGAIVLDVDSPGGLVDGVPETAAEIRQARGRKSIVAAANTQAGSAAYWLASQATEVTVTPSGEIGSIGVFAAHQDLSGRLEQLGVDITLISAGRYKVEGNPYEPLTDEAREAIQAEVDEFYGMFTGDVAKGRGVKSADVRSGFGEGRMVMARPAVDEGMADRVATIDEAITRASRLARDGTGTGHRSHTDDNDEPAAGDEQEPTMTADDLAKPWVRDALAGRVPAGSDDADREYDAAGS